MIYYVEQKQRWKDSMAQHTVELTIFNLRGTGEGLHAGPHKPL